MITTLEQTLNGGYSGLYGEVVTEDCYRLRQLRFAPDVIFDVGANVGIFSRYARQLFEHARIIAVEPDPHNCGIFRRFTDDPNTALLECALAYGHVFHGLTAANGSGETYLSPGLGYPEEAMRVDRSLKLSSVKGITLSQLIMPHAHGKMIAKIDCEGAENGIWLHEPSMDALRSLDFIAMELHDYALTNRQENEVKQVTAEALKSLEATHDCERDGVHFWATKRI